MAQKKKAEEHVNHERWLVSYADFITLLFATFTALFAMSNADKAKWEAAAKSINQAFKSGASSAISAPNVFAEGGASADSPLLIKIFPESTPADAAPRHVKAKSAENPPDEDEDSVPEAPRIKGAANDEEGGGGPAAAKAAPTPQAAATVPTPPAALAPTSPSTLAPAPPPKAQNPMLGSLEGNGNEKMADQIKEELNHAGLKDLVAVRQERRGTVISLGEAAFFAPGSIDVHPQSTYQLDKIINVLRDKGYEIRVEGHTDNTPVTSGRYHNNWELSNLRAARIVDFMINEYRFPPESLSAAGFGEFRPIAANDSEDGKRKNRRVDIVILNQRASDQEPHPTIQK